MAGRETGRGPARTACAFPLMSPAWAAAAFAHLAMAPALGLRLQVGVHAARRPPCSALPVLGPSCARLVLCFG
eukprot:scaffold25025_cov129-Isochrysis_galbana.AAC.1